MAEAKLLELEGRMIGMRTLIANLWGYEAKRLGWPPEGVGAAFEYMAAALENAPASGADEETLTIVRFHAAEEVRRTCDLVEHHRRQTPD